MTNMAAAKNHRSMAGVDNEVGVPANAASQ
jgi:hypothetical protein